MTGVQTCALPIFRHPDVLAQLGTALRGEDVDSRELALSRDPGRTFVSRAAPVTGGGAVLVLHDVTDLRRADQIRRDFVANVSHELRTPLTAIRGYAEALMDDDLDPADRRKFLDIVHRNTVRLSGIVEDILTLAYLEEPEARHSLERAPIAAEDIVRQPDPAVARQKMAQLAEAGMRAVRITSLWVPPATAPTPGEVQVVSNVVAAAQRYGVTAMVRPDARGRGLGRAILDWAEATVVARGGSVLQSEVKADDPRSLAIAATRGYVERQQSWESRLAVSPLPGDAGLVARDGSPRSRAIASSDVQAGDVQIGRAHV